MNDTKASAGFSLGYDSGTVRVETWICLTLKLMCWQVRPLVVLFYDAPTLPDGVFDDFLAIPNVQKNVSSRSYYDLVSSLDFLNPSSNVSTRFATEVFHPYGNATDAVFLAPITVRILSLDCRPLSSTHLSTRSL
jgi:hypothetical protein